MDKKINISVIGLGHRGCEFFYKTLLKNSEVLVTKVSDLRSANFEEFEKLGIQTTTDPLSIFNDPLVDAVFIATPDNTHGDYIIEAAKANKHIIVEKPLEITEEKTQQIEKVIANYGSVFMVGYVLRYAPLFVRAKEIISSGTIGDIYIANGMDHIDYGGYAFFRDWHRRKAESQSLLLQKSTHSLDIFNWLIDSKPVQVFAQGSLEVFGEKGAIEKFGKPIEKERFCHSCELEYTCEESIHNLKKYKEIDWEENWPDNCVFDSEIDVDDNQSLLVSYENKTKLSYSIAHFSSFYRREFSFIGTKGEIQFDDESNTISVYNRLTNEKTIHNIKNTGAHGGGDDELLAEFIRCIKKKSIPRSGLKSSASVTRLVLAAQHSIETNQVVTIGGD